MGPTGRGLNMLAKRFKLFMVIAAGMFISITLLGSGASATGDHPFPWPRVFRCPISWQGLSGRYRVEAINTGPFDDHLIVLSVRPSIHRVGAEFVEITEYTPGGELFAQGDSYAPQTSRSVRSVLRQDGGQTQYLIEMRAYRRRLRDRCDSNDVILSISYCSTNGTVCEAGPAYELVRTQ